MQNHGAVQTFNIPQPVPQGEISSAVSKMAGLLEGLTEAVSRIEERFSSACSRNPKGGGGGNVKPVLSSELGERLESLCDKTEAQVQRLVDIAESCRL